MSFKAVRLGRYRFQRCPVGDHWTLVTPVDHRDLSDADACLAEAFDDGAVP
jgi:hypothetical protein